LWLLLRFAYLRYKPLVSFCFGLQPRAFVFFFFFRKCLTRWHKAKPDGMRHIVVRSSIKRGQPKTKPAKGSKNFFRVLTGNNMGCLYAGQHQFLFRGRATSKKSGFLLSAIQ